ncbi:MAG: hypothetical protein HYW34_03430 [Candidatus Brennerbacteria bacterium]|nr:hypothetical protein [Candidatus Brennerbacteria bacterium]
MKRIIENFKLHHLAYLLAGGGIFFAALNFNFNNQPLFTNLNQFILVAEDKIELAENVQISSGDLAANKEISIAENNIINGNLFSDEIKIAENTTINGNISFNQLELTPSSKILGVTSSPVSLPIIQLPNIPDFPTGNQKLIINQTSTINPGNFDEIEVKENITLTLTPGTYNLNKLKLENNSSLLFSGLTIINVQKELVIGKKVLIVSSLPSTGSGQATDLQINIQEDKDIDIGENSLLSFKLLAPNSQIDLGERITFRGQILARGIKIGEGSILSKEEFFTRKAEALNLIIDDDGSHYPVNHIVVNFSSDATFLDAQDIANLVAGRIVGFTRSSNSYLIEVATQAPFELTNLINLIESQLNPQIEGVLRNYILHLSLPTS